MSARVIDGKAVAAALREQVRSGMQQIATQLDSLLVTKGRKIRFDED